MHGFISLLFPVRYKFAILLSVLQFSLWKGNDPDQNMTRTDRGLFGQIFKRRGFLNRPYPLELGNIVLHVQVHTQAMGNVCRRTLNGTFERVRCSQFPPGTSTQRSLEYALEKELELAKLFK